MIGSLKAHFYLFFMFLPFNELIAQEKNNHGLFCLLQSVANAYYTTQQVSAANSRITDAETRLDAADTKFNTLNTAVAAVQTSTSSGSATCTQVNVLSSIFTVLG